MTLVDLIFTAKTYRERARGSGLARDVQFNAGQMVDFLDGVIAFLEQERPEASAPPHGRTWAIAQIAAAFMAIPSIHSNPSKKVDEAIAAAVELLEAVEKRG